MRRYKRSLFSCQSVGAFGNQHRRKYSGVKLCAYPNLEGGGDLVRQKIPQGYGAALLSPFERDGFLLTGWNNLSDGSGSVSYAAGETIYPTDDMTLYAQWHEHHYQFDSFIWAEDNKTAQVKVVCADDDTHTAVVDAEMLVTAYEATCEEDAYTVYEAVYNGHSETKILTEEDSALGHNYGTPEWTWSTAYAETDVGEQEKVVSAVMAMPCSRCGKTYTWDADVESEVTAQPTETQPGLATYTATVTVDGTAYTDETTDVIPALGLPANEATELLIDAIGEVSYSPECKAAIEFARAAYDALTDDEKALVDNAGILTAAEARYAELEAAAGTPESPTGPEDPTDPGEPEDDGLCKWCGQPHTGIWGRIVGFFHTVLYFFAHLIGRR